MITQDARVALGYASGNSYASFVLSKLPACSIYIITQVILAFWLILAYDLLEDRRTIDVIIKEFLPLPF